MPTHLPAHHVDVRVETRTEDDVFVQMLLAVHYYRLPNDANDRIRAFDEVTWQIAAAVFDAVDARMPKIKMDDIFEKREELAAAVKLEVAPVMFGFGFAILDALVTDIRMRSSRGRWVAPAPSPRGRWVTPSL